MINILYLITTQQRDGPGNVLINIVNNLDKSKFKPFICYMYYKHDAKESIEDFISEDIPIFCLNMKSILKGWLDFSVIKKIRKIIKENQITIIHMHLHRPIIFGTIAAKNIFKISTIHNQEPHQEPHNLFEFVVSRLERWALTKSNAITTVSKAVKDSIIKAYSKNYGGNIEVVYNGVNMNNSGLHSSTLKEKYDLQSDEIILASIARLEEQKGIIYLIQAAELLVNRKIENFKLFIIGEGYLEEKLKNLVIEKKLNNKIIFTGYLCNIQNLLNEIDIIIMPSIFEGLGLSLIEGMAHSKCCIGTNVGGIPEVLGDLNLLVECKNPSALADKLEKVILDEQHRNEIGNNLFNRYKDTFTNEIMIYKYEDIYMRLSKMR